MKFPSFLIMMAVAAMVQTQRTAPSRNASGIVPRFEDYAVSEIFKGKPAQPILVTNWERSYRTMIRSGSSKGPNFAGHYTIAFWGCGSQCESFAIIDARKGEVFDSPPHLRLILYGPCGTEKPDFRLNSRLLVVQGILGNESQETHWYEWKDDKLTLLRRSPVSCQ